MIMWKGSQRIEGFKGQAIEDVISTPTEELRAGGRS
jgi:hypothetical protein